MGDAGNAEGLGESRWYKAVKGGGYKAIMHAFIVEDFNAASLSLRRALYYKRERSFDPGVRTASQPMHDPCNAPINIPRAKRTTDSIKVTGTRKQPSAFPMYLRS